MFVLADGKYGQPVDEENNEYEEDNRHAEDKGDEGDEGDEAGFEQGGLITQNIGIAPIPPGGNS